MPNQIEVKLQIILHATDDLEKIINSLEETFSLNRDKFQIQTLMGHFENPITVLSLEIKKNDAQKFVTTLFSNMNRNELKIISETLGEQITSAGLKIRISKQQLIMNKISLEDKDALKIIITVPVYIKKNFVQIYRQALKIPE
jgi:RNA binding exosome subunit